MYLEIAVIEGLRSLYLETHARIITPNLPFALLLTIDFVNLPDESSELLVALGFVRITDLISLPV